MRILFLLYSDTDTCSFYRSGGIAPDLSRRMGVTIDVHNWNTILLNWQTLLKYDLIMIQRAFNKEVLSLCKYIKGLGIPLWMDWDDYLLEVPRENKMAVHINFEKENIIEMMRMADVISVPTKELLKQYSPYNSNIQVIPNAFNDTIWKKASLKARPFKVSEKVVLWRGSPGHIHDLLTVSSELNTLIRTHPDWRFHFAGFDPFFLQDRENLTTSPVEDPLFYFNNNRNLAPHIMHVPLNDSLFNRCKSTIAYIEATFFGAICVAPAWEDWILPGAVNYTQNDHSSFFSEIETLINARTSGEYDTYPERAWEYIKNTMLLSKTNQLRVDLITELMDTKP